MTFSREPRQLTDIDGSDVVPFQVFTHDVYTLATSSLSQMYPMGLSMTGLVEPWDLGISKFIVLQELAS